jgi:hypothetical protein
MNSHSLHPAYFQVRFRGEALPEHWPDRFVVITAYATTGEQWSPAENQAVDQKLLQRIQDLGVWHVRLTGYSPQNGHAEPGWAVEISLNEARTLGREFLQDAIYWVSGDKLEVTRCTPQSELIEVGRFRERLDIANPSSQPIIS